MNKSAYFYAFLSFIVLLLILSWQLDFFGRNDQKTNDVEVLSAIEKDMDSLSAKSTFFIYLDPDSSRYYAEIGIVQAKEVEDKYWQSIFYNALGVSYLIQADYQSASDNLFKALHLAQEIGNIERMARTYNNIGILNRELGNHRDALHYYLESNKLYKETQDMSNYANVLNNIGVLYMNLRNYNKALEYGLMSYAVFEELGNYIGMHATLNGSSLLLLELGEIDSALVYSQRSIEIAQNHGNNYGLSNSYRYRGKIYEKKGDLENAENYYTLSRDLSRSFGLQNNEVFAEIALANLKLKMGHPETALMYALSAKKTASLLESDKITIHVNKALANIYEELNDFERAYSLFIEANNLDEKLIDQNNLHKIYNLEIEQLNENMLISQLEIEKKELLLSKRNYAIIIISLIFLIIIVSLVMIISKIRHNERVRLNQAMLKHSQETSKAALEAEINERKRLGLELHDGLGPLLSLTKMSITSLQQNPSLSAERKTRILEHTVETINQILKEVKYISHSMAPVLLIEKGLESAVRNMVIKLNENNNCLLTLDVSGLNGYLDPYLEHALYRCILEIVNNAVIHSGGNEVCIQIIQYPNEITVMIEDNGRGFELNAQSVTNGLGLKSTSSRIEGMKGKMYIDSTLKRGTTVTMTVPLHMS